MSLTKAGRRVRPAFFTHYHTKNVEMRLKLELLTKYLNLRKKTLLSVNPGIVSFLSNARPQQKGDRGLRLPLSLVVRRVSSYVPIVDLPEKGQC